MKVFLCEAEDVGTGRLRVPRGGRLGAVAEMRLESGAVICGVLSPARWSDATVATGDVFLWRGVVARPALDAEGEAVAAVRVLGVEECTAELAELHLRAEESDVAAAVRSAGPEGLLWATQIARELLQDCLFPACEGENVWRVYGGALLGRLAVAGSPRGRVTRRTAVTLAVSSPELAEGAKKRQRRVGGLDGVYAAVLQAVRSGQGVLLKGPPGTGKTALVRTLCDCEGFGLHYVHGSADRLRLLAAFADARHEAAQRGASGVSVVFIDEVDALRSARDLLSLMDGAKPRGRGVAVVGATNGAERLDAALRRPGRFDLELMVGIPTLAMRREILRIHTGPTIDVDRLASRTVGYVGADLVAVLREARENCVGDEPNWGDLERALVLVGPSPMRGAGVEVPRVAWDDIGGLEDVKESLRRAIEWPITRAADMAALGVRAARGVLLHGPPGCAKTTLVRALATNISASFLILTPETVYSPFVGSAEATVRECFERARGVAPCIVFIDEIDALAGKRGGADEGHSVQQRVLSTLLNEMDGLDTSADSQVVVVAATNRLDMLDDALLRPGRFDGVLEVRPPQTAAERLAVLRIHSRGMALGEGVAQRVLPSIAETTSGLSGAQLEAVCREAGLACMREDIESRAVEERHFVQALDKVRELL